MRYSRLLTMTAVALVGLISVPALAAGTAANTPVTNSVTLTYSVNSFAQTPKTSSVVFVVDRAIATLVATVDPAAVSVTPGQTAGGTGYPALNFDVKNAGNDTQDLWLAIIERGAVNVTSLGGQGTGAAFAAATPVVAVDTNGNGTYEAGTDTVLTPTSGHYVLSNVAAETTTRILVAVNVPVAAADLDRDAFTLVAGAALAGGGAFIGGDSNGRNAPGFSGAVAVADDPATAQNVFGDLGATFGEDLTWNFFNGTAGAVQDVVKNGVHSDTSAFVVKGAKLFIAKSVQVLWDPINGNRYSANNSDVESANQPKALPGAVLMYAVGVSNDAGSPSATGINISDNLPNTGEIAFGSTAPGVNVPDTVSMTLGAGPVSLDIPNSPNMSLINYRTCAGATANQAYGADPAEVQVALSDCAASQNGVIVYFVTVQ